MKADQSSGVIVGIAGAAGDGLDKTGDTLARTASRLGLSVFAYNSYQSIIRGGHIWLRIRLAEGKVTNHGDALHALMVLNQDSLERHVAEVEPGGVVFYDRDRVRPVPTLMRREVQEFGLPVRELAQPFGKVPAVMQNAVLLGAMLFWLEFEFAVTREVLQDTFAHKSPEIAHQNTALAQAGYQYAEQNALRPVGLSWDFGRIRRPFVTGNEALAMGAVAGGCKFYAAYPMTPASSILHWLVAHSEAAGVLVKQAEDELAVINMAIGASLSGVRAMGGTSGGGFALMSEAIGLAAMLEAPVVIVNSQRGGPSTGLPTKTGQEDLNQVLGASQGDYPRIVMAPYNTRDAYYSAAEALNLAERFQCPVIILSDLLLSEHPETLEPSDLQAALPIDRGHLLAEAPVGYKRYQMTTDGISPRVLPGTPGTTFVAASDEHDEEGNVISDQFTNAPLRRKMHEKRMRKMDGVLPLLEPPCLAGPQDAEVTLVGWGSTWGAIQEAVTQLAADGIVANHLHLKYLIPFHRDHVRKILSGSRQIAVVENNISGQFARHLLAETGIRPAHLILKYDGEPFRPREITIQTLAIVEGKPHTLGVLEHEAREIAYHHIRIHLDDRCRPSELVRRAMAEQTTPVWHTTIVDRDTAAVTGTLLIDAETGATLQWLPA
jgi:2-oxoglutarate ferredoxin oxidoreductase subunit alpha